jgi:hypothetical protein
MLAMRVAVHWQAPTSPCRSRFTSVTTDGSFSRRLEARPWYAICHSRRARRDHLPMNLEGVPSKCLGCGTALGRGGARTLCHECRCFAKLAPHGTRCPQCRSDDVVYTTERTGQETLFCASCDYVWTRTPASDMDASGMITDCRVRLWGGVERRQAASSGARPTDLSAATRRYAS